MKKEKNKKEKKSEYEAKDISEQDDQEDELGREHSENLISGKRLDD